MSIANPWPLRSVPNGRMEGFADKVCQRSPKRRFARFSIIGIAESEKVPSPPKRRTERRSPFAAICPNAQKANPQRTGCLQMLTMAPGWLDDLIATERGFELARPVNTR